MATYELILRENDLLPLLDVTLVQDSDNTPHDLTSATVVFSMSSVIGATPEIDEASASIINAEAGQVRYTWQDGDTTPSGTYYGEFEVTFSDGSILSFPENEYILVIIQKEVA